ncbi:hypothetical protein ELY38_00055 [Vreelandella nanhaiensis]|uniref:Uncharacterized protein n=2 Tax=Vreelandella TaxID=3137766 RepID=A0A433KYU6_9GAMM|nr:hypothetical protein [Halomonas glaciei]RUR34885.1 hypothetical protein ELY38_00055 [Halomonas nanhaiensis]
MQMVGCSEISLTLLNGSLKTVEHIFAEKSASIGGEVKPHRLKNSWPQKRLGTYHSKTRRIIVPISGNRDLWYIKRNLSSNPPSERHGLTIIFAAMHRLSELARYDPNGLERHLYGTSNWLITEFMTNSADQFIDQMASEITGFQFWRPAIRTP